MNKFGTQKLVVVEPIDPDKRVDLLPVIQRLRTDAGGDEGGECRGVDGDSSLVQVVQDGESLGELVLTRESLNVIEYGARVLAVERQGLRKRVLLGENRRVFPPRWYRCSGSSKRRRFGLESVVAVAVAVAVVGGGEGVWREREVEVKGNGRWRGYYRIHWN